MIQCDLQFEILSRHAQMKFREIKFYEKASVAFGISAIISIPIKRNFIAAQDAVVQCLLSSQ